MVLGARLLFTKRCERLGPPETCQREEAGLTELGVGRGKAGSPALTGLSTVSIGADSQEAGAQP